VPIASRTTRLPAAEAGQTNAPRGRASLTNNNPETGKPGEPPKEIEIVFVVQGDHVKAVPVKDGISDENYTEITEGLKEGDTVVSGGYKAINRDLEDGKKVVLEDATAAAKPKAAAN
jgi:HlyD family secretion protein